MNDKPWGKDVNVMTWAAVQPEPLRSAVLAAYELGYAEGASNALADVDVALDANNDAEALANVRALVSAE